MAHDTDYNYARNYRRAYWRFVKLNPGAGLNAAADAAQAAMAAMYTDAEIVSGQAAMRAMYHAELAPFIAVADTDAAADVAADAAAKLNPDPDAAVVSDRAAMARAAMATAAAAAGATAVAVSDAAADAAAAAATAASVSAQPVDGPSFRHSMQAWRARQTPEDIARQKEQRRERRKLAVELARRHTYFNSLPSEEQEKRRQDDAKRKRISRARRAAVEVSAKDEESDTH